MIVLEFKLQATKAQYEQLDKAIRTGLFVRNSIIRAWMDGIVKSRNDAYTYCKILASNPEFPWAKQLNSMARQAHAERAWASVERFFENCRQKKPGKKGYPKFKKQQTRLSVEYKTSGWKLSQCRRFITFTDGFKAGTFKMWGTRDLHFYQLNQIKRIRIVRQADGYYAQFCVDQERIIKREPTNKTIALDVGLKHFYTDSNGETVENPRHLRKSEKALKRLQRRLSQKKKGSKNRAKAKNKVGRKHLKVSRQRKDFAVKTALCVVRFNDLVAYEDLKVRNMVKNRRLAKSISDAAWTQFRQWVEYFGKVYGVATVAVPPHYTSQKCANCGNIVKKTLSCRTHVCPHCNYQADRDHNAAINILEIALRTVGHTGAKVCEENDLCLGEATQKDKSARKTRKGRKQKAPSVKEESHAVT